MKFITKTASLVVLAMAFAAPVFATEAQDIVTGPAKEPIRSIKFGNCVQTKWDAPSDPCAPAVRAEVVTPRVYAPAVEPVKKLAREQLTIYFPFNKDMLTPESKQKLDQIADAVNRSPKVNKVNIVGYTDEIGSNSYNNKLSVKRANSAKKYIDAKMRIPAGVVGLRGLGKQDPVTTGCDKNKNRKKKIACLARDRRVEIEFDFQK